MIHTVTQSFYILIVHNHTEDKLAPAPAPAPRSIRLRDRSGSSGTSNVEKIVVRLGSVIKSYTRTRPYGTPYVTKLKGYVQAS